MAIDWTTVRVHILWGERKRCELHWRLGRRSPDSAMVRWKYSIWFVWTGRGTVQLGRNLIPLRTGLCLWMRPGGTYNVEQDPEDRLGVTAVHFDLLDSEGRQVVPGQGFPPEVHDLPDVMYADALLKRVVELLGEDDENWRGEVPDSPDKEIATLLLSGLLRDIDMRSEHLDYLQQDCATRVRRNTMLCLAARIRENSGEMPSIKELADEAGYTPDHFARVFESVLGVSPQAYAVQMRINRARQLLVTTDMSISEIADALGYQDVFFFSRQFKQKVGTPPSQYRRQALGLSLTSGEPDSSVTSA